MQVNKSDPSSLPPAWQSDTARQSNASPSLLPSQRRDSGMVASPPLQSIALLNLDLLTLLVQHADSPQGALALSALDRAAFTSRFDHPRLQHLHFKTATAITEFLSYC